MPRFSWFSSRAVKRASNLQTEEEDRLGLKEMIFMFTSFYLKVISPHFKVYYNAMLLSCWFRKVRQTEKARRQQTAIVDWYFKIHDILKYIFWFSSKTITMLYEETVSWRLIDKGESLFSWGMATIRLPMDLTPTAHSWWVFVIFTTRATT